MDLVEEKIVVYDAMGKRMSFGGKDCGAVTSLKVHTTTSGNKLLKSKLLITVIYIMIILHKEQLPKVEVTRVL